MKPWRAFGFFRRPTNGTSVSRSSCLARKNIRRSNDRLPLIAAFPTPSCRRFSMKARTVSGVMSATFLPVKNSSSAGSEKMVSSPEKSALAELGTHLWRIELTKGFRSGLREISKLGGNLREVMRDYGSPNEGNSVVVRERVSAADGAAPNRNGSNASRNIAAYFLRS